MVLAYINLTIYTKKLSIATSDRVQGIYFHDRYNVIFLILYTRTRFFFVFVFCFFLLCKEAAKQNSAKTTYFNALFLHYFQCLAGGNF